MTERERLMDPGLVALREEHRHNPLQFAYDIDPESFDIPFSSYHPVMADEIANPDPKYKITMFLANRGGGKTTFALGAMVAFLIAHRGIQFVVTSTAAKEQGGEFLEFPKAVFESEEFIRIYGDWKTKTWKTYKMRVESKVLGINAYVTMKSRDMHWPGYSLKIGKKKVRPQVIFFEDLESLKKSMSAEQVSHFVKWLFMGPYMGMDETKKVKVHIHVIGTTYTPTSAYIALQKDSRVKTYVFPALVMGRHTEWLKENLYAPDGSKLKDGDSTLEQHPTFNKMEMMAERAEYAANQDIGSWESQRLMQPPTDGKTQFDQTNLRYFRKDEMDVNLFYFYLFMDMAYSVKKWADKRAVALIGVNCYRDAFVWDYFVGKPQPGEVKDIAIGLIKRNNLTSAHIKRVGIESTMFSVIADDLDKELRELDMIIPIEELMHKNVPKPVRIMPLLTVCNRGMLHVQKGQTELFAEINRFDADALSFDGLNLLDAISYVTVPETIVYPSVDKKETADDRKKASDLIWKEIMGVKAHNYNTAQFNDTVPDLPQILEYQRWKEQNVGYDIRSVL